MTLSLSQLVEQNTFSQPASGAKHLFTAGQWSITWVAGGLIVCIVYCIDCIEFSVKIPINVNKK